ncbi:MAG: methyltransferase domain-containing protein [Candidatus Eisenbacteria bacterium]|nr:methyltransferase domain-containing protein [Candidatus Eisenbacteria bacterium]
MTYDAINRGTYERKELTGTYVQANLHIPEVLIFVKYRDEIAGKRVLDVGCGAGRTAVFLSRWTERYTALDYSSQMLERARRWLPDVTFVQCDARDMKDFGDGSFDVVFFANNGFDSLDHEGRLRALAEIRRVLAPGGHFFFSSHNRDHRDARLQPTLRFTFDPFMMVRRLVRFHRCVRNHRRNSAFERDEREYAIVNDRSHNYSLITYYMTIPDQVAQLRANGFETVEVYNLDGENLPLDGVDTGSGWLSYVARRLEG